MSAPVTVAVVSWNTAALLRRCLRSLRSEVAAGRAEVWVVDNGSTDGSPLLVEREFPEARLLRAGENLGYGRAVNLVAARAGGEWIAAANADIELEDGALAALLDAGRRDRGLGAVAPRLLAADGSTQHSVHPFPTVTIAALLHLAPPRLLPRLGDSRCLEGFWDPERARRVDWAHGAFLLVRREAFDRIGGFDPAQWMFAEDIDLAWRLRELGLGVAYEPTARVRHVGAAATGPAFGPERTERYLAATYRWIRRRRGAPSALAFGLVNIAGATLRWLVSIAGWGRAEAPPSHWRGWCRAHRAGLRGGFGRGPTGSPGGVALRSGHGRSPDTAPRRGEPAP